jgi:hypothetical protein
MSRRRQPKAEKPGTFSVTIVGWDLPLQTLCGQVFIRTKA